MLQSKIHVIRITAHQPAQLCRTRFSHKRYIRGSLRLWYPGTIKSQTKHRHIKTMFGSHFVDWTRFTVVQLEVFWNSHVVCLASIKYWTLSYYMVYYSIRFKRLTTMSEAELKLIESHHSGVDNGDGWVGGSGLPTYVQAPLEIGRSVDNLSIYILYILDRFNNVKKKNNFGFQHSIGVYFVPFIDIKTYAKNQSDQIRFSDLSTISKFWKSWFLYLFFRKSKKITIKFWKKNCIL